MSIFSGAVEIFFGQRCLNPLKNWPVRLCRLPQKSIEMCCNPLYHPVGITDLLTAVSFIILSYKRCRMSCNDCLDDKKED